MTTYYRPVALHRITRGDPRSPANYMSRVAQGLPVRTDDPELQRLESGISMFDTEERARAKAQRFPFLEATLRVWRFQTQLK